jgi:dephospho-CoA kinase
MEQHSAAESASPEKVMRVLLRSAEMHWRGQLRENSIRKLPNRFVQRHAPPHILLNESHLKELAPRVTSSQRFPQLSSSQTVPVQHLRIPVVGIVGGVGAGKSTIVQNVADLQLFVIDADRIGHDLLQTNLVRNRLRDTFGDEIFDEAGQVERNRLAEKVFGDSDEQTQNRNRLNEISHPVIRTEIEHSIRQAPQDADAIILDAALLLEADWADVCDAVVFVDTPLEKRQQRVATSRGWSAEELQRREASQWSLLKKRAAAEFVVDNADSPEAAAKQMTQIIEKIGHRTRKEVNP